MENTFVSLYTVCCPQPNSLWWRWVLLCSRHKNINVRTLPHASSIIFCHKTEKRAWICLCQMQSSINPDSMCDVSLLSVGCFGVNTVNTPHSQQCWTGSNLQCKECSGASHHSDESKHYSLSVFVASFVCQSRLNSLFGPEAAARLCRFYSFDDFDFQCKVWRVATIGCAKRFL